MLEVAQLAQKRTGKQGEIAWVTNGHSGQGDFSIAIPYRMDLDLELVNS